MGNAEVLGAARGTALCGRANLSLDLEGKTMRVSCDCLVLGIYFHSLVDLFIP